MAVRPPITAKLMRKVGQPPPNDGGGITANNTYK